MAVRPRTDGALAELLREERRFHPPVAFRREALVEDPVIYAQAAADPEGFWEKEAEQLH